MILGGPCLGTLGFAFPAGSQVTMRQDCSAYAEEPLRIVGLLEAAHQYSLQDMGRSTRTPIPTSLSTQEWQFKNLISKAFPCPASGSSCIGGGGADSSVETVGRRSKLSADAANTNCKYKSIFLVWPSHARNLTDSINNNLKMHPQTP